MRAGRVVALAWLGVVSGSAGAAGMRRSETYGALPLAFEVNRGQFASDVRYAARGRGAMIALTPSGVTVGGVKLNVVGARYGVEPEGEARMPGRANYFIGNDPSRWVTDVPTFSRVRYRNVRPGVDWVFHGDGRQLEYDFEVSPGASLKGLRVSLEGVERLGALDGGALELSLAEGTVVSQAPRVFQRGGEGWAELPARYVPGERSVGFAVPGWSGRNLLRIDPVLTYSTYIGGSGTDECYALAVDGAGNAYVTGSTGSTNFPTLNPVQAANDGGTTDAFVAKLNAAGDALVYSTYLGGNNADQGNGIAVDTAGNAYVTGYTSSPNFPTHTPVEPNLLGTSAAFVTKLGPTGSTLVYSTYLGGSGYDLGNAITADDAGNAFVVGLTESTNFPMINAYQSALSGTEDAFLTKFNPSGSGILYSSYLGGSSVAEAYGVALDSAGSIYVAGYTNSANFPTTAGVVQGTLDAGFDVFVTKFNPSGATLAYSTFLGGAGLDQPFWVAVDSSGSAYLTGYTNSGNFPLKNPFQASYGGGFGDAFVAKLAPNASALVYSSLLGGSGSDTGLGVAVDSSGNAYVTGQTGSSDFPVDGGFQDTYGGAPWDSFLTVVSPSGALISSSFLGGSLGDLGTGVAVDGAGNVYLSGYTNSTDFPTKGPYQPTLGGSYDVFVTKVGSGIALPDGGATDGGGTGADGGGSDGGGSDGGGAATDGGNTATDGGGSGMDGGFASGDGGLLPDGGTGRAPPSYTVGCDCRAGPGAAWAWLAMLLVLAARRHPR